MALFKVYRGLKDDFESVPMHDGYAYFLTDSGEFYIDYKDENDQLCRKALNANKALKLYKDNEGTEIEVDVDDLVLVDEVYTKEEMDEKLQGVGNSHAYRVTLAAGDWVDDGTWLTQAYENEELKCGKSGDIPPIITYTSNYEDYSKIDHAEATTAVGITFYVPSGKSIDGDIDLIITDLM